MCRPCPGTDIAHDPEDIERFYIIMMPTLREAPVHLLTAGTTLVTKRMLDRGEWFLGIVLDSKSSVRASNATHICITPTALGQGCFSLLRYDKKTRAPASSWVMAARYMHAPSKVYSDGTCHQQDV